MESAVFGMEHFFRDCFPRRIAQEYFQNFFSGDCSGNDVAAGVETFQFDVLQMNELLLTGEFQRSPAG